MYFLPSHGTYRHLWLEWILPSNCVLATLPCGRLMGTFCHVVAVEMSLPVTVQPMYRTFSLSSITLATKAFAGTSPTEYTSH